MPVRLCLAALPGQGIDAIERVYSHIQALGQAEPFLRSRPWTLLAATNTAGSGRLIRDRGERGSAAVLSPRAARTLRARRCSRPTSRPSAATGRASSCWRTPWHADAAAAGDGRARRQPAHALAFSVRNEPGTLVRALGVIAGHGINMTKLESRPSREGTWEYVFWVDLDADVCPPTGRARPSSPTCARCASGSASWAATRGASSPTSELRGRLAMPQEGVPGIAHVSVAVLSRAWHAAQDNLTWTCFDTSARTPSACGRPSPEEIA